MDFITPALLNGVGVVGMLAGLFWMLASGRLVTRREADAYTRRAEAAEKERAALIEQNGELMEMARLGQSMFRALNEVPRK